MTPLKVSQASREILGVGHVQMSGRATAPAGWLLCDGAAVNRTTYADLFTAIGETFGVGDGSTTFNLPNNQGVVPRGAGSQTILGSLKDGWTIGTVEEDRFQDFQIGGMGPEAGPYYGIITTDNNVSPPGGYAGWGLDRFNTGYQENIQKLTAMSDGTHGDPRKGDTTRDSSISYNFYILY